MGVKVFIVAELGVVLSDDSVVERGRVTKVSAPSLAEPTDTDFHLEDPHLPYGRLTCSYQFCCTCLRDSWVTA